MVHGMNLLFDVWAAWRTYRLLRGWRRDRLVGRVWVRFNVHPHRAATARSYMRGGAA